MIKAVIFDLDNTVYDYDECHQKSMAKLQEYACNKYSISEDVFMKVFDEARGEVKKLLGNTGASHNRMLYMQLFLEKIEHNPLDGALELYDIYWDTMLENMTLFPYVIPLMDKLNDAQITVGVLTDLTVQIQHRKIKELGLTKYIDVMVTSEEAGQEKPSKIAFDRLKSKVRCLPHEMLMIGDSQKKDIDGAIDAGMNGLLFTLVDKEIMGQKVMECINDRMDKK